MSYFDDLSLLGGNEYPRCRAAISRKFETIYSLQLSLGGPLSFGCDHALPWKTTEPIFFWHHPAHSYQYQSEKGGSWHHLWISFRGPRGRRLVEQGFMRLSPAGFLLPREIRWAAETMRELICLTRSSAANRDRAALLLEELLLWARDEAEQGDSKPTAPLAKVREVAHQLRRQPDRQFNFSRVAAGAGISLSHFRALFRQVTGRPPHAYLLHFLMERAAKDLAWTKRSVGQIGARAGYLDAAQFSKAFKKIVGCSPEAFRHGALRKDFPRDPHS